MHGYGSDGPASSQHQGQKAAKANKTRYQGHPTRHGDSSTWGANARKAGATLHQRSTSAASGVGQSNSKSVHQGQRRTTAASMGTSVPVGKGSISSTGRGPKASAHKGTWKGNHAY